MLFVPGRGAPELPDRDAEAERKTNANLHSKTNTDANHNAAEKADTAGSAIIASAI